LNHKPARNGARAQFYDVIISLLWLPSRSSRGIEMKLPPQQTAVAGTVVRQGCMRLLLCGKHCFHNNNNNFYIFNLLLLLLLL
jgi:hypothetical protein